MTLKNIDLFDISRFRAEHMGMAIIFIMLFHVPLPRADEFYGLYRMGNIGVDIFLFLSGLGLWFSWCKTDRKDFWHSYIQFYFKRLLRIYPAWFIMACAYYIPRFDGKSWADLAGDILINWDFWLYDELTFWFIPAIMMLYLFAPPYMQLIRKHPIYQWLVVIMIAWCMVVQYVTPIHQAVGHLEIFWSRVPIFFIGINIGESVRQKRSIDGQALWMILIMFAMPLGASLWLEQHIHGRFPLYIERMLYIPLTVSTILLLNYLFRRTAQWLNKSISWFGIISLEIYLVHLNFVLPNITPYHLGYWPTLLIMVAVTMPLAWILHRINTLIANGITSLMANHTTKQAE